MPFRRGVRHQETEKECEVRVLITGAAGMLGSSLVPAFRQAGHDVIATDLAPIGADMTALDVRDPQAVAAAIAARQPDLVAHLAAETDVDRCEREPEHARLTNAAGTYYSALACQRAGLPMVYVSTAGVFDGAKRTAYTENDEPRPINVYGRTKFEGERLVQRLLPASYIARAGWMIGGGTVDKKFVRKIIDQVAAGAGVLYAVVDKFGTPTYAPDFARCLVEVVEHGYYGTYHMACTGWGTRLDVARAILDFLGRDDIVLTGVTSEFFAHEYPAARPRSEIMQNSMLELLGMNHMRPWQVALAEYLDEHFRDAAVRQPAVEVA